MEDRLLPLLDAYLENRLSEAEASQLRDLLRSSPEARRLFWEYVEQDALIADILSESRGRDLALLEQAETPPSPVPLPPSRRRWALAGALTAAAALLIALGPWFAPAPVTEPMRIAILHALTGEAHVVDALGEAVPATVGAPLHVGELLRVADEDAQAEVRLADGSQVSLGAGTHVRFLSPGASAGKVLHLERGAVQVEASPGGADRPLVVTTDQARITARETRFRLYREEKASRMELEEGKARLERPTGEQALELSEGSFVVVSDEHQPMVTQPLPTSACRLRHTFLKSGDSAAFAPDGGLLVTRHFDRGWRAWRMSDGTELARAPGGGQRTGGLAFAGSTVVALTEGGTAALWQPGEGAVSETRLRDQGLRSNVVSRDGRWLAQGSRTGEVTLWEADAAAGTISLRRSFAAKPSRVAVSSAGPWVVVGRWGGEIEILSGTTGEKAAQFKLRHTPTPLAVSPDGRRVAAYANVDGLVLFDRESAGRLNLWPGFGARVDHLHFTADGGVLLAGLQDGTVRAWSTSDGRSLFVLETGHRHVNRVETSRDQSLLATVGDGDCVKVWDCKLR